MALGGALLVLTLWLWVWLVSGHSLGPDYDSDQTQVSAPPNLLALIPEAAKATVAAGYGETNVSEKSMKAPSEVSVSVTFSAGSSPGKETVLSVGDSHYAWKEWGEWHCNCPAGSMSRMRDIAYSMPNVHLDPVNYDMLRFERLVCNYQICQCAQGQCNRSAVSCSQGPMSMCALQDIKQNEEHNENDFWSQVHKGLRDLWKNIKEAFPQKKEPNVKSRQ